MNNLFPTRIITLVLVCWFTMNSPVQAQNLDTAIQLYEQGDYERALQLFEQYDSFEAQLYAGKSAFALNQYIRALHILDKINATSGADVYADSRFTKGLSYFQLKQFSRSLEVMKELSEEGNKHDRVGPAIAFYDKLLGYLTPVQRRSAFLNVNSDEIRYDLIESALGRLHYSEVKSMFQVFKMNVTSFDPLAMSRMESTLRDSLSYVSRYPIRQRYSVPDDIAYSVGVLLPEFEFESPEYEIPQHLYYGIQLAVEQFNSTESDKKILLSYRTTTNDSVDASGNITDLIWNEQVDVIIGPLFSEVASRYAEIAEDYEIPVVLPLANADSLDLYNNFVFQLNPPFAAQGRRMAAYAVDELGYDTLGVIAESRSLGSPAARAFLREAEKREAMVRYYFEEDLESIGYDITDYTRFFTTDTTDSVDMVQAVYAPFTGTVAPTLIESMLTDLEAMRSTVDILGSEEWSTVDISSRRLSETRLYFTRTFLTDTTLTLVKEFESAFRLRFGTEPNQFAYIGFDAAQLVANTLNKAGNPKLFRAELTETRNYRGLIIDVDFDGTHQNSAISIGRGGRIEDDKGYPGLGNNERRK